MHLTDLKSHTAVTGLLEETGQKLNRKSSTEAELVALNDSTSQIVWTRNFLEEQGYKMEPATVYQDNIVLNRGITLTWRSPEVE